MASGADLMGALLPSVASQLSKDGGGQVSVEEDENVSHVPFPC